MNAMNQTFKHNLKTLLLRAAPGPARHMQTAWQHRHVRRFEQSLGLPDLAREFTTRHGLKVQSGPFAGMEYIAQATGSALVPKLVGSYEQELHDIVREILRTPYTTIVDVGCAEGYYAVGLARALREAKVIAFDTDSRAQRLCRMTAERNGVSNRVQVAGRCDAATLQPLLTNRALVISDCEGYERDLLDLERAPGLRHTNILVELHDAVSPGLTPALLARFANTHDAQLIDSAARNGCDYACLDFLPVERRQLAVSEFRPLRQQWAFFRARQPHSSSPLEAGAGSGA